MCGKRWVTQWYVIWGTPASWKLNEGAKWANSLQSKFWIRWREFKYNAEIDWFTCRIIKRLAIHTNSSSSSISPRPSIACNVERSFCSSSPEEGIVVSVGNCCVSIAAKQTTTSSRYCWTLPWNGGRDHWLCRLDHHCAQCIAFARKEEKDGKSVLEFLDNIKSYFVSSTPELLRPEREWPMWF